MGQACPCYLTGSRREFQYVFQKGCSSFLCNEDESVASWRRDKGKGRGGCGGLVLVLVLVEMQHPHQDRRKAQYISNKDPPPAPEYPLQVPWGGKVWLPCDKTYQSYWYVRCRLRLINALRKKNDPRNQSNRFMVLPFYLTCLSYQHLSDRYTQQWFQG